MKKLKVAVIGLGVGRMHIDRFNLHPQAEVVAICDSDGTRLKTVAEEYKIKSTYVSADKMLSEAKPDIVSVATPNVYHKPLTIAALQHGAHVLCEKPMAMNAEEAEEMLAEADKAKRRLMINFSYRFSSFSQAAKRQVDSGILGQIYFARTLWHRRRGFPKFGSWFGQKKLSGGGPLIDLGVHRIDLALWLMGYGKPAWVLAGTHDTIAREWAEKKGKVNDCEDLAVAMIRLENGVMLEAEASWALNQPRAEAMETSVFGNRGGLCLRNKDEGYQFEGELTVDENDDMFVKKIIAPDTTDLSAMQHLVDCILEDKPHDASGEDGHKIMQILDGIYKSARLGKPVEC
jgi:predicted dehydrogenase